MALQTVKVTIDSTEHTLVYNEVTSKYEKTITAPSVKSTAESGGYYNMSVTATNVADEDTTEDGTTNVNSRLYVYDAVFNVIKVVFNAFIWATQTLKSIFNQVGMIKSTLKAVFSQSGMIKKILKAIFSTHVWTRSDKTTTDWTKSDITDTTWTRSDKTDTTWK